MKNGVEFRIAISPYPALLRRVHFIAASLEHLGGAGVDYEIVVCVGGDVDPYNLYEAEPWSTLYPITWRWVSRDAFQRDGYWENARELFRQHGGRKYVSFINNDILFTGDFSDLIAQLDVFPAVAGVIAHRQPFGTPKEPPAVLWSKLFEGYGVAPAPLIYEHPGWNLLPGDDNPNDRLSPAYYNFAMVIAPFQMADKISGEMIAADDFAAANITTNKRFQVALTLSIQKHELPAISIPHRYNFPNDPLFEKRFPEELADVRFVHYTDRSVVHRDRDLESLAAVAALIARRDLTGSNEILRQRLEDLYPIVAAEEQG